MNIEVRITPTIHPISENLIAANVPIQVPRSCLSETRLTCALEKPKSPIILNIARNDIAKPITPRASGAKSLQSFANITKPIHPNNLVMKDVVMISKDFLAIIITELNHKILY